MKYFSFILFCFYIVAGYGQDTNKVVYFTLGKPWHPDLEHNLNNLSFSLNYQNKFANNFAYDIFYTHAKSTNYPSFFNNSIKLKEYLISQRGYDIISNSKWSDIYTNSLGVKIHYAFINNSKWFFSFNFSIGYFLSKASRFEVGHFSFNTQTGEIYSYESSYLKDDFSGIFLGPGMQFNYNLIKKYFVGLDLNAHFSQLSDEKFNEVPEIPNYYNIAIIFGVKF